MTQGHAQERNHAAGMAFVSHMARLARISYKYEIDPEVGHAQARSMSSVYALVSSDGM